MIAEAFLKKREKRGEEKGRAETEAKWRKWYEENRDHISGAAPPTVA